MAPKRGPPVDEPSPSASSSEEEEEPLSKFEEEDKEDDEGYDSSESDQPPEQKKPVQPNFSASLAATSNPRNPSVSSSTETGSESHTDTDTDDRRPVSDILKPPSRYKEIPARSTELKRSSAVIEDVVNPFPKKLKQDSAVAPEESSKKPLFQRVWRTEDEIVLLEGMIDFVKEKGVNPSVLTTHAQSLLDFIGDRLQVDVSVAQLLNKIRSCRRKYGNNLGKGKNGEDRVPSKPLHQKAFELAKKLWGGTAEKSIIASPVTNGTIPENKGSSSSSKKKKKTDCIGLAIPVIKEVKGAESFGADLTKMSLLNGGCVNEDWVLQRLDLVEPSTREYLEKRLEKLRMEELRLQAQRSLLVHDAAKLIIEVCDSKRL